MEETSVLQSKWNMDDARLKAINSYLNLADMQFYNWDLEKLYWTLRTLKRMSKAKFKDKERIDVDLKMNALEQLRKKFLEKKIGKGEYYIECENFYEMVTQLMKEHGLYFREYEDDESET